MAFHLTFSLDAKTKLCQNLFSSFGDRTRGLNHKQYDLPIMRYFYELLANNSYKVMDSLSIM